ncbi:hypothetical protein GLYMA_13G228350v4 [Glycine max]|nr:hypothetical protein GLYMA_13G228350v4 [Glycine max]KAH1102892.1 hypothetical protein GYH30_037082 [Glycine max]
MAYMVSKIWRLKFLFMFCALFGEREEWRRWWRVVISDWIGLY